MRFSFRLRKINSAKSEGVAGRYVAQNANDQEKNLPEESVHLLLLAEEPALYN
jgi:hypothetical protein